MKVDTFQCDVCHKQKQVANHWFRAYAVDPADGTDNQHGVLILKWEAQGTMSVAEKYNDVSTATHLCGAACMNEWLSKNLLN